MKCQNDGCKLSAKFNVIGSENPLVCDKHQQEGMIHIRRTYCRYCTNKAQYGYSHGKPLVCKEHKKPDMGDVKHQRCQYPDCKTRPNYNFVGQNKGIYCKGHKKPDMFCVTSEKCQYLDCNKQPNYNFVDQSKGIYCKVHKKPDMVDVKNKTCQHLDCNKQPSYNFVGQSKSIYCKDHKVMDMVCVKNKTCQHLDCNKQPSYNFVGQTQAIYCKEHKKSGMVDVNNKLCKTHLCGTHITKKYEGYCYRCFIYMRPDSPLIRNYKTKERHVVNKIQMWLNQNYQDLNISFDKKIQGGCSLRRPDMFMDLLTHVIVIEVDENQHKQTPCETLRLVQLFEDVAQRPCVFIRFNPDGYTDKSGKKHKSCFKYTKKGLCVIASEKEMDKRLVPIYETLKVHLTTPLEKSIHIEQYWYDKNE